MQPVEALAEREMQSSLPRISTLSILTPHGRGQYTGTAAAAFQLRRFIGNSRIARRCKDGIGDRGRDWRQRAFAEAPRGIAALDEMNVDLRNLGNPA